MHSLVHLPCMFFLRLLSHLASVVKSKPCNKMETLPTRVIPLALTSVETGRHAPRKIMHTCMHTQSAQADKYIGWMKSKYLKVQINTWRLAESFEFKKKAPLLYMLLFWSFIFSYITWDRVFRFKDYVQERSFAWLTVVRIFQIQD